MRILCEKRFETKEMKSLNDFHGDDTDAFMPRARKKKKEESEEKTFQRVQSGLSRSRSKQGML